MKKLSFFHTPLKLLYILQDIKKKSVSISSREVCLVVSFQRVRRMFAVILRKIQMNCLNPVFIELFYDHTDSFFGGNRVTGFWKKIKLLDDKASERIIIFRFQIQIQGIIEIVKIGRTFNNIFVFAYRFDIFFFILIIFIVDFANNLFKDIF